MLSGILAVITAGYFSLKLVLENFARILWCSSSDRWMDGTDDALMGAMTDVTDDG